MTPEEKATFWEQYQTCHQGLNRFCMALCKNREEARDLAGETMLTGLEAYPRLKNRESFRAFLFGIAIRLQHRQNRRKKWWGLFNWEKAQQIPEAQSKVDFGAEMYLLNRLLSHLPEPQRKAFVLFELSDLSIREISELQQSNENTVKTRLSRARFQLKQMLEQEPASTHKNNLHLVWSLNKESHGL